MVYPYNAAITTSGALATGLAPEQNHRRHVIFTSFASCSSTERERITGARRRTPEALARALTELLGNQPLRERARAERVRRNNELRRRLLAHHQRRTITVCISSVSERTKFGAASSTGALLCLQLRSAINVRALPEEAPSAGRPRTRESVRHGRCREPKPNQKRRAHGFDLLQDAARIGNRESPCRQQTARVASSYARQASPTQRAHCRARRRTCLRQNGIPHRRRSGQPPERAKRKSAELRTQTARRLARATRSAERVRCIALGLFQQDSGGIARVGAPSPCRHPAHQRIISADSRPIQNPEALRRPAQGPNHLHAEEAGHPGGAADGVRARAGDDEYPGTAMKRGVERDLLVAANQAAGRRQTPCPCDRLARPASRTAPLELLPASPKQVRVTSRAERDVGSPLLLRRASRAGAMSPARLSHAHQFHRAGRRTRQHARLIRQQAACLGAPGVNGEIQRHSSHHMRTWPSIGAAARCGGRKTVWFASHAFIRAHKRRGSPAAILRPCRYGCIAADLARGGGCTFGRDHFLRSALSPGAARPATTAVSADTSSPTKPCPGGPSLSPSSRPRTSRSPSSGHLDLRLPATSAFLADRHRLYARPHCGRDHLPAPLLPW